MTPGPTSAQPDGQARPESDGAAAVETLTEAFMRPLVHAREYRAAGLPVAMASAHQVPSELLRAAGFVPIVHRATTDVLSRAELLVEDDALGRRAKSLIEAALSGDLTVASLVTCSRSSEQDYKAYLYLRELGRQGLVSGLPPILLFDILYSRTPEARAYGVGRTRQFLVDAAAINGRDAADARLGDAIRESNAARAAMRRLLALREGRPRVTGTRALALLGARAFVDCPTYTTLLNRAIAELAPVAPLPGPRLLLLGAPPDDTRLHGFLETLGAVVVAEDGGWGTRGVGRDIAVDADPFVAIFDKYYDDVPASRTWAAANDAWVASFTRATTDGVVFYLPPEDSVSGWDHPRQRAHFEALHIPSLVIRDDATDPAMTSRWEEPAREFLARLAQAQ